MGEPKLFVCDSRGQGSKCKENRLEKCPGNDGFLRAGQEILAMCPDTRGNVTTGLILSFSSGAGLEKQAFYLSVSNAIIIIILVIFPLRLKICKQANRKINTNNKFYHLL